MNDQYEYETINIPPGHIAITSDLNALASLDFRFVGVIPLVETVYSSSSFEPEARSKGCQLLFERKKDKE
jgi:hypothetical protein